MNINLDDHDNQSTRLKRRNTFDNMSDQFDIQGATKTEQGLLNRSMDLLD